MTALDPFNQHPFHEIHDWLPQPEITRSGCPHCASDPYASNTDDDYRIDFERAPNKFFRGFIEIVDRKDSSSEHKNEDEYLKTRMKTKNLILMNN
jgi:hypothetical protein